MTEIAQNLNQANSLFLTLSTLLVLLMTPALAMFYSGMVRQQNTLNTIMNCFIAFGIITLQWLAVGYTLSFGDDFGGAGIIGDFSHIFFTNISGINENGVPNTLFAIYQMAFALIASAIITGSLVGRIKLGVLVIFLIFWSTLVYDVLAHMIWSEEGFFLVRGGLDFAGGGVVHVSSGVAGLVGALIVGKRKESENPSANATSIPYAFLGAILLFIGWLGFNSGSSGAMDLVAINAFIVSIVSAASGYSAWVLFEWWVHKRPTILGSLSGLVAGLVGITPACGYVSISSAIFIGAAASLLCYTGLYFIKYKLKLDDSLDAFSLHGIGGVWGALSVGLFADSAINPVVADGLGNGLFVGGGFHLLAEQAFSTLICIVLSAVVSYLIFKAIALFTDLRVNEEIERAGLDVKLHGERAYNR